MINKIAFWLSVFLGVLVLTWPSLAAIFKVTPANPDNAAGNAAGGGGPGDEKGDADAEDQGKAADAIGAGTDARPAPPGFFRRALGTASSQTSVTALAALSFAIYAHYKDKQSISENLMRTALYTEMLSEEDITAIVDKMIQMDQGFQFDNSVTGGGG